MEDGYYRVVPKEGTSYEILGVEDDIVVAEGDSVDDYLAMEYTFTRVYPLNLPKYMMEWVHSQALMANIEDDDVVEEALRRFMSDIKKGKI